jgi:hypothetical protein
MSDLIPWQAMKDADGICNTGLEKVISKLGGKGITLSQARKACKEGVFPLWYAVIAATALELPNWELALGKVVAFVHPKAKKYYTHKDAYRHNQKALEEGRLADVDRNAAHQAAVRVADWAARVADWAAAKAARVADAAVDATWAAEAAALLLLYWAAGWDTVNDLIDIYFDALEEA